MAGDAKSPSSRRKPSRRHPQPPISTSSAEILPSTPSSSFSSSSSSSFSSSSSSSSSPSLSRRSSSLALLRDSLPDNPNLYHISEIRSATNNFLAKRHSPSSWRCTLRGKDVLVFQRKLHRRPSSSLRDQLSFICRCHHVAVANLLGASASSSSSSPTYIYLVYEFLPPSSTNLADLLRRNPNNPSFSPLSSWMSRIQIATDLANALDYIHNNIPSPRSLVHNHITSTSVIVTPTFNAKICHFGAAYLCGEPTTEDVDLTHTNNLESESEPTKTSTSAPNRQGGNLTSLLSPEMEATGIGSQRSDVYAFGVVLLELLSGQEPVKFKFDRNSADYVRVSVIDSASEAVEEEGRLRRWLDGRLHDSFPVEVARKLTRLALQCVDADDLKRPNMTRVAAKISKLYLESNNWADTIQRPSDFSVSYVPR